MSTSGDEHRDDDDDEQHDDVDDRERSGEQQDAAATDDDDDDSAKPTESKLSTSAKKSRAAAATTTTTTTLSSTPTLTPTPTPISSSTITPNTISKKKSSAGSAVLGSSAGTNTVKRSAIRSSADSVISSHAVKGKSGLASSPASSSATAAVSGTRSRTTVSVSGTAVAKDGVAATHGATGKPKLALQQSSLRATRAAISVSKVSSHVDWLRFDAHFFRDWSDEDAALKSRFLAPECHIVTKANVYPNKALPPIGNSLYVPLYTRRAVMFLKRRSHALSFAFDLPPQVSDSAPLLPTPMLDDARDSALPSLESADALVGGDDASRVGFVSRLLASAFRAPAAPPDEPLMCDSLLADATAPFDVDRDLLDNDAFKQSTAFGDEFYELITQAGGGSAALRTPRAQRSGAAEAQATPVSKAFRFVVTAEKLVFDIGTVEPLFGVAALYDMRSKQRLSETFHFDLNGDNLSQLFGFENDALRSRDKSALFCVAKPSGSVVLVVRIERLLRGDVDADVPTYSGKAKDLTAAKNAFAQDTRKLASRGSRLQPLAWAATELFNDDGAWRGGRRVTMELMAATNNQCSDQWVLEKGLLGAAKRVSIGRVTLALRRLAPLIDAPTTPLNADHEPVGDGLPPMLVHGPMDEQYVIDTAGGFAVTRPMAELKRVPEFAVREVQSLEAPDSTTMRYYDFLYVFPESVVLKQEANVMVEVTLSAGETTLERCICQRSDEQRLSQFGSTGVVYRSKQPNWYDQIKIRLPAVVTTAHVLRFTFFHVVPTPQLREKSSWIGGQKAAKERVVLGTAVLPLIELVPSARSDADGAPGEFSSRLSPRFSTRAVPLDAAATQQHEGSPRHSPAPSDDESRPSDSASSSAAPSERTGAALPLGASPARFAASSSSADVSSALAPPTPSPLSEAAGAAAAAAGDDEDDSLRNLSPDVRVAALTDTEATGPGGQYMRRFLPDGPHVLPVQAIRWIENKRHVFVVRTQLVSSVRSSDDALLAFFHTLAPTTSALRTAMTTLFQARMSSLILFFPTIAGHLVSVMCTGESSVAINAINVLRVLLSRIHAHNAAAATDAADCYTQRAFRLQKANGPGNSSHNVLAVPRDAHITLTMRWSAFRRKLSVGVTEYPDFDAFMMDMILRSLAMANSQSAPQGVAGADSARLQLRRPTPEKFVNAFFRLLCSLADTADGEARELRLVTRTVGRLASLLLPSQFLPFVHRFVRYLVTNNALVYSFQLTSALLVSPHTLPFDCSATPLTEATSVDDGGELAADGEYAERCAASVHGISSLLVSLARRVLCNDMADPMSRRAALLAIRDAVGALERMDFSAAASGTADASSTDTLNRSHSAAAASAAAASSSSAAAAASSAAVAAVNSAISGSPAPAAPPLLTSGSRKSSSNNTPTSNAAALLQLTPRRRATWSRALRSGLIGAYVSLLGAVSRMHAAAVWTTRRPAERYELMVASVAVLRAAPAHVLFDEWLLRVDNQARRAFVLLMCEFARMVRCAPPAVRAETYRVCVRTMCLLMARLDASGVALPSAADAPDATAIDVIDGALTLANMALHIVGGRRYIAALVTSVLRVKRMRAALFPRTLGDVDVPSVEVLAALLLRMCCGESEKRSLTPTAHGNETIPKVAGDDAALRDDVAASDSQLGRTLLLLTLRADSGGASGQLATNLARAGAFACANGGDARQLLSSLMRLAGVDQGRWGPTLAPTLDALSRAAAAQIPQIALDGRGHALAEGLLGLAASSLSTAPGAAFVWLETLARTHVASSAGLGEEIAHVRLLAAALVASHMRKEGRLENLLALLLERAFAHASAAARRVYALCSDAAPTPTPTPTPRTAAASPFALWQRAGLLRLLDGAAQSLAHAGASRACTELCHALAHAAMVSRQLGSLARIHELAAASARELVRRAGAELETSLLFLVRFRGPSYADAAAVEAMPGFDFVYRQALAGYSTTEQVAGRLRSRIVAECRASGALEPQVVDELPSSHDGAKLLVVVEPLFPMFDKLDDGRRLATTDHGLVLRGQATAVFVRWRHAFPGPLARSRVLSLRTTVDDVALSNSLPLSDAERAQDSKEPEGIFRSGLVDDPAEAAFTVSAPPAVEATRRVSTKVDDDGTALQYFAAQREIATVHKAFQILRKRVVTSLDQAQLQI
jgi:hypothetical protein